MVRVQKIIITSILLMLFCTTTVYAGDMASAIESYKSGNYDECITTMKAIVKDDPTSVVGYYYLGLAYARTGKKLLAIQNYNKVIALNSDETLTLLAKQGKEKFGGKEVTAIETQIEDIEDEYNPIFNDSAIGTENNNSQQQSNFENKAEPKTTQVIKASDYAKKNPSSPQNDNSMPTNDEIVNAIRVLQRAGLLQNGMGAITGGTANNMPPMDTRTQQMQSMLMMMNGNNNGYGNNMNMMQMMPYINNGGKVDPQVMQMMLMNQMMPNFSGGNGNNGY